MEIIEIQSKHSLLTSMTESRPDSERAYKLNCRHYISTYKEWQRHSRANSQALGVMTLDFERIWITAIEGEQIVTAIQAARSPVVLD
ncbi:MAG TPA: hypothetical protein VFD70_21970 [Anaerolineae bacterium]|nr:hypothetical protein [Anaerolineae bacterium]